ncbi:MAG TPA: hypothetical protein VJJ82_00695 [Candidatus Nanoarchaeia archaeon]|nr:hypothetical protein [Candidatus Nanoarchaeia archaeon]
MRESTAYVVCMALSAVAAIYALNGQLSKKSRDLEAQIADDIQAAKTIGDKQEIRICLEKAEIIAEEDRKIAEQKRKERKASEDAFWTQESYKREADYLAEHLAKAVHESRRVFDSAYRDSTDPARHKAKRKDLQREFWKLKSEKDYAGALHILDAYPFLANGERTIHAQLYERWGDQETGDARKALYQKAIEHYRSSSSFGYSEDGEPADLKQAGQNRRLAALYDKIGDFDTAHKLLVSAFETHRRHNYPYKSEAEWDAERRSLERYAEIIKEQK